MAIFQVHLYQPCSLGLPFPPVPEKNGKRLVELGLYGLEFLQCFDAVGWVAGRASSL